jgi:hypothetical protein
VSLLDFGSCSAFFDYERTDLSWKKFKNASLFLKRNYTTLASSDTNKTELFKTHLKKILQFHNNNDPQHQSNKYIHEPSST